MGNLKQIQNICRFPRIERPNIKQTSVLKQNNCKERGNKTTWKIYILLMRCNFTICAPTVHKQPNKKLWMNKVPDKNIWNTKSQVFFSCDSLFELEDFRTFQIIHVFSSSKRSFSIFFIGRYSYQILFHF